MKADSDSQLAAALRDAERRYVSANPKSQAANVEASRVMPGGSTRSVLFYTPFPVTLSHGEGPRIWDLDGHVYCDLLGEYSAGLYGHSHPVIIEAVREALKDGLVLGGPNRFEVRLAELIRERFPSCELLRFCNSGTEANLMAVSTARIATGRTHLMAFEGSYHGGVLNYGHGNSPLNVPFPTVLARYNDVEDALGALEANCDQLAAVLVEPLLGAGGAIPGQDNFLAALREATSRHGIVLIFDEVMTSRLSTGGRQTRLGLKPDMTTLGKYLGGGLTFGAFGGRRDLMELYDSRRPGALSHAGTFNNNVLTMAAGVAGLSKVLTPEALATLHATGERLRLRLNRLGHDLEVPVQVTGEGSMLCVHFQKEPIRRPADATATPDALRALFHLEMMLSGYYLARRGFMALSLLVGDHEIDGFYSAFEAFVHRYRELWLTH